VGSEAGEEGLTRSFLVDVAAAQVEELPLREPRRGVVLDFEQRAPGDLDG
jgi:hypothetical protein